MENFKKFKILYLSTMRICSGRANMIQTLYTAKYFSEFVDTLCFYPARSKDHANQGKSIEEALKSFFGDYFESNYLKRVCSIDLPFIEKISSKLWFYLLVSSYYIFSLKYILFSKFTHIYIREPLLAFFIILTKYIFRLKLEIIYESHNPSNLDKFISKKVKRVVCISSYLLNNFKKRYKKTSLFLAEDAAELNSSKKINIPINLKRIFRENENKYKIVYVGSTFMHKGYDFLINSAIDLPDQFRLILIGGSSDEVLKNKKRDINKSIIFSPIIEHKYISYILSNSDLLLLPNIADKRNYSSSPLKLYEYLLSNKPILFSDIDNFKDIMSEQPLCFSFKNGNKIDFIRKLKIIYSESDKFPRIFREVNSWKERSRNILLNILS